MRNWNRMSPLSPPLNSRVSAKLYQVFAPPIFLVRLFSPSSSPHQDHERQSPPSAPPLPDSPPPRLFPPRHDSPVLLASALAHSSAPSPRPPPTMPKAPRSAPLNCLLAINKPTGLITQHLLNKLQPLLASSTLFKDPNAVHDLSAGKGSRKRKWRAERVKLGQGGTLDPLADGVLG